MVLCDFNPSWFNWKAAGHFQMKSHYKLPHVYSMSPVTKHHALHLKHASRRGSGNADVGVTLTQQAVFRYNCFTTACLHAMGRHDCKHMIVLGDTLPNDYNCKARHQNVCQTLKQTHDRTSAGALADKNLPIHSHKQLSKQS